jgi:hypothetical protein
MTSPVFDDALFDTVLFGGDGELFDGVIFDAAMFDAEAVAPSTSIVALMRANVHIGGGYAAS